MLSFTRCSFVSLLVYIATNGAFAASPTLYEPVAEMPSSRWHVVLGTSGHYAKADSDIRDYAVISDTNDLFGVSGEIGHNTFAVNDADYEFGYDIHLGILVFDKHGFFVDYDNWNHTDNDQVDTEYPEGVFVSNLGGAFALSTHSKINYDYDAVKVYYRHTLPSLSRLHSHILLGFQWSSIDAHKSTVYDEFVRVINGDPLQAEAEIHLSSSFEGIGPLFGISARYLPFKQGLGLFGSAAFSALTNDSHGNRYLHKATESQDITTIDKSNVSDRVAYHTLVKVGVDYVFDFGHDSNIRVGVGYQSDYYFNVIRIATGTNFDSGFRRSGIVGEFEFII